MGKSATTILALAVSTLVAPFALGQIAFDSAQNYTTWLDGSNAGFGYGAWTLRPWPSTNNAGFFLGNSNGNGSGAGPGVNSPNGTAFGMYSNSGIAAVALRPLNTAMTVGDTISIDFDNGWIDPGMRDEWILRSGGRVQLSIGFTGGNSFYDVFDAGGLVFSTIGFTDGGVHMEVTQLSVANYSLLIRRLSDGLTWTTSGAYAIPGFTDEFAVVNSNAGAGSTQDLFFNNPMVVPEPATLAVLGMALALTARSRKRA